MSTSSFYQQLAVLLMLFYHADGTTDYANYPCKTKDKPQIVRYLKGASSIRFFGSLISN